MDMNTRLIDMTAGELVVLIKETIHKELPVKQEGQGEVVKGLKGLAKLMGVSVTTAQKAKNSGLLDDAIGQVGRQIYIDEKKAREILIKRTNNCKTKH